MAQRRVNPYPWTSPRIDCRTPTTPVEATGVATGGLLLPGLDLTGVHLELFGQLRRRPVSSDCGQGHACLEGRAVIPTFAFHLLLSCLGLQDAEDSHLIQTKPVQPLGSTSIPSATQSIQWPRSPGILNHNSERRLKSLAIATAPRSFR